jgi:uncharacterized protein YndB with AHSA1/START domain
MNTKTETTDEVVVERSFDVPVARVWRALTEKEQMREWYFDLKEFRAEVGFEFEFIVEHKGMTHHHLCKITEVVPEKKLAYTWRYNGQEGNSLVAFELSAEAGKTHLKLTHRGLASFPRTPAYQSDNFRQGWNQIIGVSLPEFLEPETAHAATNQKS